VLAATLPQTLAEGNGMDVFSHHFLPADLARYPKVCLKLSNLLGNLHPQNLKIEMPPGQMTSGLLAEKP
jgi:hypothetical protein